MLQILTDLAKSRFIKTKPNKMNELQNELHQIAYDYLKYEAEYNQDHEITANTISERSAKKVTDHYAPIIAEKDKEIREHKDKFREISEFSDKLEKRLRARLEDKYKEIGDLQKKVAELEAEVERRSILLKDAVKRYARENASSWTFDKDAILEHEGYIYGIFCKENNIEP